MKACLTLIVALGIAVEISRVAAVSTPEKYKVIMSNKGSISNFFDPLSPSQRRQPYAVLIPPQFRDKDTFGLDDVDEDDDDGDIDDKKDDEVGDDDDGDDDEEEEEDIQKGADETFDKKDIKEDEDYRDGPDDIEELDAQTSSRRKSILNPIAVDPPLSVFARSSHLVQPARVRAKDKTNPLPTNKFYGNLMLGDSHAPIWTHPYGLRWESGPAHQGLGISHIDDIMKGFGPPDNQVPAARSTISEVNGQEENSSRFYINPFLVSLGLSATELDSQHEMTIGDFGEFSCSMILLPANEKAAGRLENPKEFIRVPVVRGMAFVTGVYNDLTPRFYSNILVRTLTQDKFFANKDGWVKYRFLIENGVTWLVYAKPDDDQDLPLTLEMRGQGEVVATSGKFKGLIQITKVPVGNEVDAETLYDNSFGVYATRGELIVREEYVNSVSGGYRIDWKLEGESYQQFIHFTLPHHRAILTNKTTPTSLVLPSTTKGKMVAYIGSTWHLYEPERLSIGFLPDGWSENVTPGQLDTIRQQAEIDCDQDFVTITDLDSMYFAGKGLAKFGLLCLVVKDVLKDEGPLQKKCLDKLKTAFARYMENRQMFPLAYDTTWKGLISVQGFERGPLADFGNSWYNDHHYHYGYFVHSAAIIRHLDPTWRTDDLRTFTHGLLRDVVNPSKEDTFFPVFRAFDWFMGHSWSQGIFVSLDGKDEESTSEDINLYYAMSLWANTTQQSNLEHLGQVMLTIARRSIQSYFLMEEDNMNHPRVFVGNKVTGILFENKVDHTTYFSPRIECIQGIQMIPVTPALPLIRRKEFVRQEWESLLQSRIKNIDDGWKSILMMNYGTLDKDTAWEYFTQDNDVPLDDGMTKTWALFYVASQKSLID